MLPTAHCAELSALIAHGCAAPPLVAAATLAVFSRSPVGALMRSATPSSAAPPIERTSNE
jgi:hypothetical protein